LHIFLFHLDMPRFLIWLSLANPVPLVLSFRNISWIRGGHLYFCTCHFNGLPPLILQLKSPLNALESNNVLSSRWGYLIIALIIRQGIDHSVNLQLIGQFITHFSQFTNHVWHGPQMLPHGDIWALLIIVKPYNERPKSSSHDSWHDACKIRKFYDQYKTHIRLIF